MIEVVVFLPESDNAGQPSPQSLWEAVEGRLIGAFGGFSRQEGLSGAWQAPAGPVYRDQNVAYTVALETVRQLPAWLEIVEWALITFRQEALYVRVAGVPDMLLAGSDGT